MDRRTLLSLVATGMAGLAGCGSPEDETETETPTPEEGTQPPTTTPPAERVERELSVWNPTPDPVFTTVVVARDGRDVYFDTVDLVPGERNTSRVTVPLGATDVLVETDTGIRARSGWTVDGVGDGLEVVLGREGAEFWGRVACHPSRECSVADGGEAADLPLVGDGSGRWYAPAGLVVENSGDETNARLRVSLSGVTLLDRTYRIPTQTRLSVPVTYRTGTYDVVLETDEQTVETEWPVPAEPTKYIDTQSGSVGCGPANTTLTVANQDDEPHRLTVRVESDGETFEQSIELAAGEARDLVPVVESGPKQVFARLETGAEASGTWWSCPPRGPASVVVDATGSVALATAGPKPG
ncbi:hypothetical protein [Haloferax sp. YSSS75]|uniref:hypothetical protein n=1 Tax=Haloferax sp. YSSS75 TaxID=3388564 RepID=UPI00398CF0BD